MKMPFGKYKKISLEFINSGYLKWLIDQEWFVMKGGNDDLLLAVERELNLREADNSHFYKDKVTIKVAHG